MNRPIQVGFPVDSYAQGQTFRSTKYDPFVNNSAILAVAFHESHPVDVEDSSS